PGVMHACGHDIHAAWAVGAAALLARAPADRDVLVVLQPGEETGRGALGIIASGALDDAQAIFGAHVDMRFPLGQVVADAGPLAASSDTFTIALHGRGAHAARPHESDDPVVAIAALVVALQSIVARRVNPAAPAVLTVGTLRAGTAPNVIPDHATLGGTLRATDAPTRALLLEQLHAVARGIADAHRVEARITIDEGTPPVVNAAVPTAWARRAVGALLGHDALVPLGFANMAAEDFAHYQERLPGCFLRIGAAHVGERPIAAHSPRFAPAEESLFVGAAVLAACAREAARALGG
ncbi:MAG TPA: M20 family metallopeptidase, partial [Gemmatimonadaceae bacterium]|nr:M20 family metallopeptidase [Gemmatimonadaceae bacterium]